MNMLRLGRQNTPKEFISMTNWPDNPKINNYRTIKSISNSLRRPITRNEGIYVDGKKYQNSSSLDLFDGLAERFFLEGNKWVFPSHLHSLCIRFPPVDQRVPKVKVVDVLRVLNSTINNRLHFPHEVRVLPWLWVVLIGDLFWNNCLRLVKLLAVWALVILVGAIGRFCEF